MLKIFHFLFLTGFHSLINERLRLKMMNFDEFFAVLDRSDDEFSISVKHSLDLIENIFNNYNINQISLSFNGGKDCTVIAYMINAVKHKLDLKQNLLSLYVKCQSPFDEVEEFVDESRQLFELDLITQSKPLKLSLNEFLSINKDIKIIFIGTRSTDPNGKNLELISITDHDWPSILRVHPILNWPYDFIWKFLLKFNIPYCSLYDKGYTSLGSTFNTHPNPNLKTNENEYKPAHQLELGSLERSGRFSVN